MWSTWHSELPTTWEHEAHRYWFRAARAAFLQAYFGAHRPEACLSADITNERNLASVQVPLHRFIRLFCVQHHALTITDRRGCACSWCVAHTDNRTERLHSLCALSIGLPSPCSRIPHSLCFRLKQLCKTSLPRFVSKQRIGGCRDAQPLAAFREASLSRRLALAVTKALYLSISLN